MHVTGQRTWLWQPWGSAQPNPSGPIESDCSSLALIGLAHSNTPMQPLDWIDDELDALNAADALRTIRTRDVSYRPGFISIAGQELTNFSSNDYLGIAAELKRDSSDQQWGSGASPLITGYTSAHKTLEQCFCEFKASESAMLFSSGFAANMGTIPAIVSSGDAVFSDARNHASIIDGCRLSNADVFVYRHNDIDHLTELITSVQARRKLIVTDTLFSMDGDVANLGSLSQIADDQGAMLMIDEAHATGVYGKNARGLAEEADVESGVHITVSTFSKALGSVGGVVTGTSQLINWLRNKARSYVYSTSMPNGVCEMSLAGVEIVQSDSNRRTHLLALRDRLVSRLATNRLIDENHPSHIVPIRIGANDKTLSLSQQLFKAGFLVAAIRPPTVPDGEAMLRIGLTANHSVEQIDALAEVLSIVR